MHLGYDKRGNKKGIFLESEKGKGQKISNFQKKKKKKTFSRTLSLEVTHPLGPGESPPQSDGPP